jgi:chaperone modulatory protein CbpM
MQTEEMIAADEFCINHNIEIDFINSLNNSGLIEITVVENKIFVPAAQLHYLEKMVRLYYEMDINVEGIETITYLLQRMNSMQQEILQLNNKLALHEDE